MWHPFDWPDALAIENAFIEKPFWDDPREVLCPIDGTPTVRSYYQRLSASKTARYRWCPMCHRYSGQTVALPPPPEFSDPVHASSGQSLPALLDQLDRLWNAGVLPQTFSR
jgi:hypothetical protein